MLILCATKKNPVSSNVFRRRVELMTLERFEVMVKFCNYVENYKYSYFIYIERRNKKAALKVLLGTF